MAKKLPLPPSEPEILSAKDILLKTIKDQMAQIPGLIPGTQVWEDALQRRLENAINGTWLLQFKQECTVDLKNLLLGGKGPVTKDPVDIA